MASMVDYGDESPAWSFSVISDMKKSEENSLQIYINVFNLAEYNIKILLQVTALIIIIII